MIVVADTDALIALTSENDIHHQKAIKISQDLEKSAVDIIFPVTVFPETITFFKRAANEPKLAHIINEQLQAGLFTIEYIDEHILKLATDYFSKARSKKNTFFDAIVAATAKSLKTELIFSFDEWYTKLGFKLAGE